MATECMRSCEMCDKKRKAAASAPAASKGGNTAAAKAGGKAATATADCKDEYRDCGLWCGVVESSQVERNQRRQLCKGGSRGGTSQLPLITLASLITLKD